jgi:hypothetical protein
LFDPETAAEWQKAVNLSAAVLLIKDALKDNGAEPLLPDKEVREEHIRVVKIERCEELLKQGATWGIVPQPEKVAVHLKEIHPEAGSMIKDL